MSLDSHASSASTRIHSAVHDPTAWVEGNRVTLLPDGDAVFQAAYAAIQAAVRRVWLEMYIIEPDDIGQQAIEALAEAARRGCDVRLLYDRWGSSRIRQQHLQPLLDAGGSVAVFNPLWPWRKFGRKIATMLHRDHRKLLLADQTAFVGGTNISTEYGGPGPELFYDLALRLEGPCIAHLEAQFVDAYAAAAHRLPRPTVSPTYYEENVPVRVLALNRRQRQRSLDEGLRALLASAQNYCYLTTPYFVPPRWFVRALQQATGRGVEVRILTAGASDIPMARIAGRHLYAELLRSGIRIYELAHPVLHAKCLVVDGRYSVVGSYNVDRYGSKHNLELGVAVEDRTLADQLKHSFLHHLTNAQEIDQAAWQQRPWTQRLMPWLLFQLARI